MYLLPKEFLLINYIILSSKSCRLNISARNDNNNSTPKRIKQRSSWSYVFPKLCDCRGSVGFYKCVTFFGHYQRLQDVLLNFVGSSNEEFCGILLRENLSFNLIYGINFGRNRSVKNFSGYFKQCEQIYL